MDRLAAIETFVRVAETQSFSEAARRLRASKSVVSRSIGALEADLGVRLFNRTTRSLSLTEAGQGYFERATRFLADIEDAKRAVTHLQTAPRGRLRVSAPVSFGFLHLAPALPDFLARYPEVSVDITVSDRFVDLVDEGFDLAVRIGALEDSGLIARKLAPIRRVVCASPAYYKARGAPETPDDLKQHECLSNSNIASSREWRFKTRDGKPWRFEATGRLSANNGDLLRIAALKGLGIVNLPTFIVGADLQAGLLATALDEFVIQDMALSAVYPQSRHLSPKVRALIDFLADRFGPRPYWDLVE